MIVNERKEKGRGYGGRERRDGDLDEIRTERGDTSVETYVSPLSSQCRNVRFLVVFDSSLGLRLRFTGPLLRTDRRIDPNPKRT